MRKFDWSVTVTELNPPIGNLYRYYAKVAYMYEAHGGTETTVDHNFGETHGETKREAHEKMATRVQQWIQSQQQPNCMVAGASESKP